jgi:hypothetical protein
MHTQNIYIYINIYIDWVGIRCWTDEKEYSMSFGRSRDSLLWLETSSCDLSSLQRFHVETGSWQWLKARCYEFTLLLVPQTVGNVSDYIVRSLGQRGLLIRYLSWEFERLRPQKWWVTGKCRPRILWNSPDPKAWFLKGMLNVGDGIMAKIANSQTSLWLHT